jgi:hypothetical protein
MSKRADKTAAPQANTEAAPTGLSADDQHHLASLQKKFALVREPRRFVPDQARPGVPFPRSGFQRPGGGGAPPISAD